MTRIPLERLLKSSDCPLRVPSIPIGDGKVRQQVGIGVPAPHGPLVRIDREVPFAAIRMCVPDLAGALGRRDGGVRVDRGDPRDFSDPALRRERRNASAPAFAEEVPGSKAEQGPRQARNRLP